MKPLKLDEVWLLLPAMEELKPLLRLLTKHSAPDPARTWASAGALETAADRVVSPETVREELHDAVEGASARLAELFAGVSEALSRLARGDRRGAAESFLALAALEEAGDRAERAEGFARAAYEVCRDEHDRTTASVALRRWARAARTHGDLATALTRYEEAAAISEAIGDHVGAAEAVIGAGNVLEERGLWFDAETRYRGALDLLDRQGPDPRPERWHALLNLHIAQRSRGLLEDCVPALEAAEAVAMALDDDNARVFLENARGQLRMAEGRFDDAERHFHTALDATEATGARVTVLLNLAEALLARRRILDAADTAREAERIALTADRVPNLPEIYRLLGRIASAAGNPDAFVLFERALEILRTRGLPRIEEARTLQAYAEAEGARGEADAARHLHEEARKRYAELGIVASRHPWSEVFDAGLPPDSEIETQDSDDPEEGDTDA